MTSLERARRHAGEFREGYSREYVAREFGISAKTVERHERGLKQGLSTFQVGRYADLYDVEPETLADMLGPNQKWQRPAAETV